MECGRCQDACPAFASGQAALPEDDPVQHGEGPARRRQGARPGRSATTSPELVPATFSRGRDLDLHDLRRLSEGLPGRDRAHPQDRRGPAEPGPDAEQVPRRAQRLLPQPGDELQSLGHRFLQAGRMGRGARGRAHQGRPRRRISLLGRLHGRLRRRGQGHRRGPGQGPAGRRASRSGRSGPRRSAAAIRPGAWATNTSSRAWPQENIALFKTIRRPEDRHDLPARLQHPQARISRSCWTSSPA
ncbi:MAG: hypothetical protein M0C28_04435 [Candidatus Moduliflexus flocculans]|nr:hypothetical protein [Candidatus Moduliflexus flocculans]